MRKKELTLDKLKAMAATAKSLIRNNTNLVESDDYEEGKQFASFKCPKCGTALTVEKSKEKTFCTNCGAQLLLKEKQISPEITEKEETGKNDRSLWMILIFLASVCLMTFGMFLLFEHGFAGTIVLTWALVSFVVSLVCSKEEIAAKIDIKYFFLIVLSIGLSLTIIIIGIWLIATKRVSDDSKVLVYFSFFIAPCIGFLPFAIRDMVKEEKEKKANIQAGKIEYTIDPSTYHKTDYHVLVELLDSMGFTNICPVNRKDLLRSTSRKAGKVDKVIVAGSDAERSKWYYPDEKIIVTYHGSWNSEK